MARVTLQGAVSNHPFQITINSLPVLVLQGCPHFLDISVSLNEGAIEDPSVRLRIPLAPYSPAQTSCVRGCALGSLKQAWPCARLLGAY